jgi:hypothetical protein
VYFVYVNKRKGRVLITRERVLGGGWRLAAAYGNAAAAMRLARFIADVRDYVLEWDLYVFE